MNIINLLSNDGYIMVNRILINEINLEASIMMGELCSEYIYWNNRNLVEDGYFYSTAKNIEERTSLKEKRQRAAIKQLEELNLISVIKKGIPCKRYIKINERELANFIINGKTSSASKAEQESPPGPTNNTEYNNTKLNNKEYMPTTEVADVKVEVTSAESQIELDVKEVIEFYKTLKVLPQPREITGVRISRIKQRISKNSKQDVIEALSNFSTSKWIIEQRKNKAKWLTYDWIWNPNNFTKILEGNYNNEENENKKIVSSPPQKIFDPSQLFAD